MELLEFEKPIAELEKELSQLQEKSRSQDIDLSDEIAAIETKLVETRSSIYSNLTPWQRVQIARHAQRPFMLDYVAKAFDHFTGCTEIAWLVMITPCQEVLRGSEVIVVS